MGIFRSSGNKKEEDSFFDDPSTRKLDRGGSPDEFSSLFPDELPTPEEPPPMAAPDTAAEPVEEKTTPPAPEPVPPAAGEPKTRVLFRRRPGEEARKPDAVPTTKDPGPPSNAPSDSGADPMSDPVVGWVVIIEGPGRGNSLQLGYGMNSIGRAISERVRLDFGDNEISRNSHAIITYDPRGRRFYVQHGGGKNLTYLGDTPLLTPAELHGGESISLGETTLRFVPLCGAEFDWQTQDSKASA